MNQFEELRIAAQEIKTLEQAYLIMDSVDALAAQALIKSQNAIKKELAAIAAEKNDTIVYFYD